MSTPPESELDLEKLFLPAWAQEPPSAKHYARYEGEENPKREPRRGPPGRRTGDRQSGPRPRTGNDRPRGDRPGGFRRPDDRGRRPFEGRPPFPRSEPRDRVEPPPPLPDISVSFIPEERGVESLARQIKTSGRAYPLFDIARLILQKPERYAVAFKVKKKPDGEAAQRLFVCALDDTLWLSEAEAVEHVLKNHFGTFYQTDRTATEPPKGKYTFVAQCGMSGVILGPPNYHDYQNQLRRLHAERFSRMPFETFKARVKIVRDEEVVKKWIDDQSWKTEYVCLNMPEPLRLGSREAVEKHFREVHKENIIKPAESHTLGGAGARSSRCQEVARLVRQIAEDQRRFPLQIATVLSQQFAGHGLQFFKVNRAITHVSVARPHFLDLETTPVSTGVKAIVDFINAHPKCTRRQLFSTLAPVPEAQIPIGGKPAETPPQASSESSPAPAPAEATAATPAESRPSAPALNEPTVEQTAVISDLHWLIHQGHVIEFANGVLDTAKKPAPRPPKPEPKSAPRHPAQPSGDKASPGLEQPPEATVDTDPPSAISGAIEPAIESSLPAEPQPEPEAASPAGASEVEAPAHPGTESA